MVADRPSGNARNRSSTTPRYHIGRLDAGGGMAEQDRFDMLVAAASEAARGIGEVAGAKPNEAPLQSDARTFRGIATMLTGLCAEASQREEKVCALTAKLRRIANLEVRGAGELIEQGNWKRIASELQAIAQEALNQAA
jgi:hypothetical protein